MCGGKGSSYRKKVKAFVHVKIQLWETPHNIVNTECWILDLYDTNIDTNLLKSESKGNQITSPRLNALGADALHFIWY
jgi:hypothetical protein